MASDVKRVVLVKPGEVLLIGNVGELVEGENLADVDKFFGAIGIQVVLFAEDIDMDAVAGGSG